MAVETSTLRLNSNAFAPGDQIPTKYSAYGDNVSPPLEWTDASEGSRSFAVFVHDPELYRRLLDEVAEGQDLRVTTETDWDALCEGDRLLAFEPVGVKEAAVTP